MDHLGALWFGVSQLLVRPGRTYAAGPRRASRKIAGYEAFSPQVAAARQRRLDALLRGLLYSAAAIALLLAATAGWSAYREHVRAAQAALLQQGDAALAQRDFSRAVTAYRQLLEYDHQSPAFQYRLAAALDGVGDVEQAAAMMRSLAFDADDPYLPAQLWFAGKWIAASTSEASARAERLLEEVLRKSPAASEARRLLVQLHLRAGRFEEVERLLNQSPEELPETRLEAAKTLAGRGEFSRARALAWGLPETFRRRAAASEDPAARLNWAQAVALCGDLRDARQILRDGLVLNPRGPYAVELAKLSLDAAQSLAHQTSDEARQQRAHWIERGLEALEYNRAPTDEYVLYQFYRGFERYDAALEHLQKAVHDRPELRVELARFYGVLGDAEQARSLAADLLSEYQARLESAPTDAALRLLAAELYVLVREYHQAVALLEHGWSATRDRRYSTALSNTYVAWWDAQTRGRPPEAGDLKLLRTALGWDPASRLVEQRLTALRDARGELSAAAQNLLDEMRQFAADAAGHSTQHANAPPVP